MPLPCRHGVRHHDQRGRTGLGHRRRADDRLAGTAREHHDAGAAVPEVLDRLDLVGPHRPAVLAQGDRVRLAVDVAGEVLGRPAELEQHLLEVAALGRVDRDRVRVDPLPDQRLHPLGPQHLLQHRAVGAVQHQPVHRVLLQPQPAVPVHRLGDVDEQPVGNRVAGVGEQRVDDGLRVQAGGPGVPQAQRRQPVGVHVLRGALQLRERGDRLAAGRGVRMVHLQQQGPVALDDQRSVAHGVGTVSTSSSSAAAVIRCSAKVRTRESRRSTAVRTPPSMRTGSTMRSPTVPVESV